MYSARLKTFDLVYPDFKGTCIEFINGIMQVCWHFKKGLHWNCQGYFWKNSVKCRKQYKAPTNSIRKLTICIDNAGPRDLHCTNITLWFILFIIWFSQPFWIKVDHCVWVEERERLEGHCTVLSQWCNNNPNYQELLLLLKVTVNPLPFS